MEKKGKLELTWVGKYEEEKLEPRILIEDKSKSYGDPDTENMLIHGDNLLALKALENKFRGRVKCIYIDPPYNTGSAFAQYDDNLEHSIWLSMIRKRLLILKELLSEDGTIWISIDDDEQAYLKVLCDEIFMRSNFVSNVIWEKKFSPQNDAKWLSDSHDFILVYAKNKNLWKPNLLPRTAGMNSRYKNPDNDPRGPWTSSDFTARTYSGNTDYPITTPKAEAEKIASENCQAPHTISVDKEFDFPSFCFDMTTGIGKSRLMGACIYYLYKTKGYKHFFILAPGNTIYDKMRREAVPGHPKYMFKGLEAEMGRPKVYDGENYLSYPVRYIQEEMVVEKTSDIQIFIFNISKIFTRGDIEFKFHKFNENLGGSFADVLRSFDDLVICMDEAHRYYAPASKKAINYLNPVLGLEYTATPKSTNKNIIYHYGLEDGAGKFLKIPVVMGRTNTAGYSDDDIEEMKLKDGIKLHERRKSIVYKYCIDNQLEQVKPIVLIACKDTTHARKIKEKIDSDAFFGGRYVGSGTC